MATAYGTNNKQNPVEANQKVLIGVTSLLHQLPRTDSGTRANLLVDSSLVHLQELYESELAAAPKARLNSNVKTYVAQYMKSNEEALEKVKKGGDRHFRIIESIFRKYDLPAELKYLAVIESQLKTTAVSHAGAVGPWQLMSTTARELGLKVTSRNDERKNFYKSTGAAARYLKDLYTAYGDWLLVIAAYNAGPGKVDYAIKRSGSRNFYRLQNFLPAETRHHVKRFIGTHYYFEGGGSEVTLTKAEAAEYRRVMDKFLTEQKGYWEELMAIISFDKEEKAPKIVMAAIPLAENVSLPSR